MQIFNKRLRDEKDHLVDVSRKRRALTSVQGRGQVGSGDSAGREVKQEEGVAPVASSSGSGLRASFGPSHCIPSYS